jgi:23S rRNA pseudouridine955/2504/2580 synthase
MSGVQQLEVPEHDAGQRLDRWFKRLFPHVPHGKVEKLMRTGQLRVNGKRVKGAHRLEAGQTVRIPPLPDPSTVKKSASERDVKQLRDWAIYEDNDLLAINKPAGLAVQGGSKTKKHIDGMLPEGFRLVHRLDRDTSGVLLIAKSAAAARWAGKAFQSRKARKIYWGVTNGVPKPLSGEIKGYMAKGELDNRFGNIHAGKEVMEAVRHGAPGAKHARTLFEVVASAGQKAGFVAMMPLTGRTHQLRLHMQLTGAPLAGDPKYMTDRPLPGGLENRLHLHARELSVSRETGESLTFIAPLPDHIQKAFALLGFEEKDAQTIDWDGLL